MNKIERIDAVLQGKEVDRPPFSFWYHFGLQHTSGERHGEAQAEFFHAYDLDFLKVMNDYPYPSKLDMLQTAAEWRQLRAFAGNEEGFGEQLRALQVIAEALDGKAYFVETIFSPWTVARRLSDTQTLLSLKRDHPDVLLEAMRVIAHSLANYAQHAIQAGAAGIFLSVSGATRELMTFQEYERFCRPFDLIILDAVKDISHFNILHIHGQNIFFNELLNYPVQAINWSHYHTAPTFIEARKLYKGCLLGGLDERQLSHNTVSSIYRQVKQAVELVGNKSLIITPGCSVATDTAAKLLHAVRHAIMEL
ncbi:MAG: uroporphyrinogen decarboxylase family protein [Acidobacteriota bacterium]